MVKNLMLNLIIIFATAQQSVSQEAISIVTDRPDITESSLTVPKYSIQIESGFSYSRNEFDNEIFYNDSLMNTPLTDQYFVTPGVLARYGLNDKIELRLGAQLTTVKSMNENPQTINFTKTNVEGIDIAVKFKLSKQNNLLPSSALIAGSSIPALNPGSETDVFDPSFTFCFSNEITENLGVGYNLGFNLDDGFNSSASGAYSLSFNYLLIESFGMFVEAYGFIPFSQNHATNFADGGITVLIRSNIQLDFSGGYGLNSENTEYFFSTGISFRLPK
ncbi:MAG: transporter [Bacteroidota bacterium]|nr:transporter [Bacteroidota bacterium]